MWKLLMDENGVFIKNPHVNAETVFNSWLGAVLERGLLLHSSFFSQCLRLFHMAL